MGFYTTDVCFFTKTKVISTEETDDKCLDGYYYRIEYNNIIREFRLSYSDDWQNDRWLNEHGKEFLELLDTNNSWSFFNDAKTLKAVKNLYGDLFKIK